MSLASIILEISHEFDTEPQKFDALQKAYRLLDKLEKDQQNRLDIWIETRWWRVLDHEGKLFCETHDEKEAREAKAILGRDGSKLQRLYTKQENEWRDV